MATASRRTGIPKREKRAVVSGGFKSAWEDSSKAQMTRVASRQLRLPSIPRHASITAMAVGEQWFSSRAAPFQINYVNPNDDPSTKK